MSAHRASLLSPSIFSGYNIVNDLIQIEAVVNEGNFVHLVEDLFHKPLVLELILSSLNDSVPLMKWIIDKFPTSADKFTSSVISKLLPRLSLFLLFQPLPLPNDEGLTREHISRCHRVVESVPGALTMLSNMAFRDCSTENEVKVLVSMKGKSKNRKETKQAKRANSTRVDTKLLESFSLPVPENRLDQKQAIEKVISTAKSITEFYFELLRSPGIAEAIQSTFISAMEYSTPVEVKPQVPPSNFPETQQIEVPSAYPMVQPMKSALYFDSAEGFGAWRILISTRADSDLREASRKDRKTFKIIVKKIKELSHGHFSEDNQKRLNGPNTEVPIFEAKMTRDSRLVYQVDSICDDDSKVERQVLRIFGVYTHAQLNNCKWGSVGRQLGRRGQEYKRRCMYRLKPINSGDNVFSPASFPPLEAEVLPVSDALDLPPDDLEQIHSLLVLEKYLTFSQELLYSILADLDVAFPFQVSPQEREIIEYPYSCYVLGRSGTGKTTTMLFKMLWIERTFQLNNDNMEKPRQIFVTKSRVLAGKVEEYFLKLLESLKTASKSPQELQRLVKVRQIQHRKDKLFDIDDDDNWRGDLPLKFSELQDFHFPLFITFDRLCDLIEGDFHPCDRAHHVKNGHKPRIFVSYDIFLHQYWPHFAQPLTKGLDPALVFSEIIGVIMGSEETTTSPCGHLDRKTYENLSERTQSTFATQRNIVYNIFEAYQTQKRQRGDFDVADRTHSILRIIANHGIMGRKIDQLCVDEAQDNLLIDALLLRSLCRNSDGLFWAGDTAQTISAGSSFRFDDLKAFLFRIEKQRVKSPIHCGISFLPRNSPKSFQLATNYRSHAGIVNCAHSVIQLITMFWPYSIDILAPEKGIVNGLKPVFLNGWDTDNVRYEQFLFGSSGSHIEFGAQQCILVRNELSRQKLQEQVGDIGLIMTLYESKGLEFNDVLLFNFFEDSAVDLSQWRIILSAIDVDKRHDIVAPRFNEVQHAGVCSELKFLYVAITRARKNLWIADQSTKSEPMRMFWTIRDQVHNCTPGTDMPRLAVSSSPEEWASKGKELFDRKRFFQAKHCYERASMPREVAISNAYHLREQARKVLAGESRSAKERRCLAFITAAEAFLSCAVTEEIAESRIIYFRRAGECFQDAAENLKAAKAYVEAHEFNKAARIFRQLGLFDNAVGIIQNHEEVMDKEVVESIKDVARLYYFREQDLGKARELFSTDEEELEYLENRDLDVARAEVLVSLNRYGEAAELHLSEGRTLDAIPMFLKDVKNKHSMQQAASSILLELWKNLSFGTLSTSKNPSLSLLLKWSSYLDMDLLDTEVHNEISMFRAILLDDRPKLAALGQHFLANGNRPAAILCLDHHFMQFPDITTAGIQRITEVMQLFLAYARLLYDAAQVDPRTSPPFAKLFGFRCTSGDEFAIPSETFLHGTLERISPTHIQSTHSETHVPGWELCEVFRRAIYSHLSQRVTEENDILRKASQLSPCLTFVTSGYCNRVGCPQAHTPSSALTADWYSTRLRAHLQQILIIQTGLNGWKRHWVGRFYEALNPPLYLLGTQSDLNVAIIPEFQKGILVLKNWVRELSYTLDFRWPHTGTFLTSLITGAILGFTFDKHAASDYLRHSRYLASFTKPSQYFRPNNVFMLPELIGSLEGNEYWSISAGILSVRHIIDAKLPVNISVLCDLIEFLCAGIVVANNLQRQGSFHGITLPHSWLRKYTTDPMETTKKTIDPLHLLVSSSGNLLEDVYTGGVSEHLLFEGRDLSSVPSVRGVFILRICRALCILGYNIPVFTLRSKILGAITFLRRPDRSFAGLYRQFILAQHWDHLVRALRGAVKGPLSDELVLLHDSRRAAAPTWCPTGVRLIVYDNDDRIPSLLDARVSLGAPSVIATAYTSTDFQSAAHRDQSTGDSTLENPDLHIKGVGEVNSMEDLSYSGHDVADPNTTDILELEVSIPTSKNLGYTPSDSEIQAASRIQRAYRSLLLHRRQIAKSGLDASRQHYFAIYLERARILVWRKNSYYRLLFLGPLPYILFCLEIAHNAAISQKTAAKKRLLSGKHEELEELDRRLTELNVVYKAILRLRNTLGPTSDIHNRRDPLELSHVVQEAADLLRNLPFTTAKDFRDDLHIAIKGILNPRQSRPTAKPVLVWDEDV